MSKKLLVRTPQTKDGVTLQYDADKKPVYKESIVELAAKKILESENAKKPEHLRHEFAEIDIPESAKGSSVPELLKKLQELEDSKQVQTLQERISLLEAELADAKKDGETKDGETKTITPKK